MTQGSNQLQLVQTQLNNIAEALCLKPINVCLSDEITRDSPITWSWGWAIKVTWNSEHVGSRYRLGNNDQHIGGSKSTGAHVQRLADMYASYEKRFFVDVLGAKISHKELENFNTGDLDLGSTGLYYISSDSCSTCNGYGTVSCSSCSGRGHNSCHTCFGSGTTREWRSNGQHGGYVNTSCYACGCSGRIRCNHCGASGKVTCSSCNGSGEHFYRFTIKASATKKVEWAWSSSEVFVWLPSFIKLTVDAGSTGAITPYLTQCKPVHRDEPLLECAYSFSMESIIPSAEFCANSSEITTKITTVGPKNVINNAGGILNPFVSRIASELNKGSILDQKPLLAPPIIDALLKAHDEKTTHFTLQENYVSTPVKNELTIKYDQLVARINGKKFIDFLFHFIKLNAALFGLLTLIILGFSILYPSYPWSGKIVESIIKEPAILAHAAYNNFMEIFFNNWIRTLIAICGSIFITAATQEFHWRKIGGKSAFILALVYSVIAMVYVFGFMAFKHNFAQLKPIADTFSLSNLSIKSILTVWPEMLFTSTLIAFVAAKHKSWKGTKIEVEKLKSHVLSKRLKLI